jgi:hypothetical protein
LGSFVISAQGNFGHVREYLTSREYVKELERDASTSLKPALEKEGYQINNVVSRKNDEPIERIVDCSGNS